MRLGLPFGGHERRPGRHGHERNLRHPGRRCRQDPARSTASPSRILDALPGRYAALTVDHLFGTVWTDETLSLRDRRLLTIGVLAAFDEAGLLEIQFDAALGHAELTAEQVARSSCI